MKRNVKKKINVVRLFKRVLKNAGVGALVICTVVCALGCATTSGEDATLPASRAGTTWFPAEGDGRVFQGIGDVMSLDTRLGGLLWGGSDLNALSVDRMNLFLYTLTDFFVECREQGLQKAHDDGLAYAVSFREADTARFFKAGWDICAEYGVEVVESQGMLEEMAAGELSGEALNANAEGCLEIQLLVMIVPQIWRDDYRGFLELVGLWSGGGAVSTCADRFERSPTWNDGKWFDWGERPPAAAADPGEFDYGSWVDPDARKQYEAEYRVLADFLADCRARGIDNADSDAVAFGGIEGQYLREYFRDGIALIREVKDKNKLATALEKLYFQMAAKLNYWTQISEFGQELNNMTGFFKLWRTEEPLSDVNLGEFLYSVGVFCSREVYDDIAAKFPGVVPMH